MRHLLGIFLLYCGIFFTPILSVASPVAMRIHGPLHTSGMRIVDNEGNIVVFRGVNVSGMEWGAGTPWGKGCHDPQWGIRYGCYASPKSDVYDQVANWGFNVVRIPISWANLEPAPGKINEEYLTALDAIIHEFGKRDIAVILSMHQWDWSANFTAPKWKGGKRIHGNGEAVWLYPESWFAKNPITHGPVDNKITGQQLASQEFFINRPKPMLKGEKIQQHLIELWAIVAQRYRGFSNIVAADIFNEPYSNQKNQLEDFYIRAARRIHEIDPRLLLVFEVSLSTHRLRGKYILDSPDFPQDKGVYAVHIYMGTAKKAISKIGKALEAARLWSVPLWIGEFHCITRHDPSSRFGFHVDSQQSQQLLDFMKKYGDGGNGITDISWTYWAYQKDAQPLDGKNDRPPANMELVNRLQHGF